MVKPIQAEGTLREFLTVEEVKKLVKAPCEEPLLKDAFMFSVLTGLRWSDIFHLKWEEVKGNDIDGWYLQLKQRKTKDYLVLPVTVQAKELLGEIKDQHERIQRTEIQCTNEQRSESLVTFGWDRQEDYISFSQAHPCHHADCERG